MQSSLQGVFWFVSALIFQRPHDQGYTDRRTSTCRHTCPETRQHKILRHDVGDILHFRPIVCASRLRAHLFLMSNSETAQGYICSFLRHTLAKPLGNSDRSERCICWGLFLMGIWRTSTYLRQRDGVCENDSRLTKLCGKTPPPGLKKYFASSKFKYIPIIAAVF